MMMAAAAARAPPAMEPTPFGRFPPAYVLPLPSPLPPLGPSSAGVARPRRAAPAGVAGARRSKPAAKKVRSSKSNVPGESRYWTPSEHKLFVEALLRFGPKNLKAIARHVGTRNMTQCRTHEQKCFMRLMREAQKETARRETPAAAHALKTPKDVYSVSSSCGITLLCVVSEEMSSALRG